MAGQGELRIVLLGKMGTGKSSSGNALLGEQAFRAERSPGAVTTACERRAGEPGGRPVVVVDTPGFSEATEGKIAGALSLCAPGPHAFLLVLKVEPFTENRRRDADRLLRLFGGEAARYTVVLLTRGKDLKGKSAEAFAGENEQLQALVDRCGGRLHVLENRGEQGRAQAAQLLEKIEAMVQANRAEGRPEFFTPAAGKGSQKHDCDIL
ncbi:GTPase IMAP family member 9-like [Lepisosteus oculatus]|uniref:GTPase IMAP family member 9-like n=1 Tax=Lepisosteus oculatus TaxID=7918 RepID=UPI0007400E3F|nr:PREDICTED: GTPase IMAP family member 2-like [Lepisosteus oculatus]